MHMGDAAAQRRQLSLAVSLNPSESSTETGEVVGIPLLISSVEPQLEAACMQRQLQCHL